MNLENMSGPAPLEIQEFNLLAERSAQRLETSKEGRRYAIGIALILALDIVAFVPLIKFSSVQSAKANRAQTTVNGIAKSLEREEELSDRLTALKTIREQRERSREHVKLWLHVINTFTGNLPSDAYMTKISYTIGANGLEVSLNGSAGALTDASAYTTKIQNQPMFKGIRLLGTQTDSALGKSGVRFEMAGMVSVK